MNIYFQVQNKPGGGGFKHLENLLNKQGVAKWKIDKRAVGKIINDVSKRFPNLARN